MEVEGRAEADWETLEGRNFGAGPWVLESWVRSLRSRLGETGRG